jgi:hypothetical protein
MAFIVVGGHTRNIGKTQLVVEILRAFPQICWTAAKITQFGHGLCSVNGDQCHCAVDEHRFAIQEERDPGGRGDTCRMLAAGARRVFWVRAKQGCLEEAMPHFRRRVAGAENLIVESNTLLHFMQPDLYLPVLDFSRRDFKASSRAFLDRADAYVLLAPPGTRPAWEGIPLQPLEQRPVFIAWRHRVCTPALAAFIGERLFGSTARKAPEAGKGPAEI